MKSYEDFLVFLEEHLCQISDFIPITDQDFHPVCFAVGRFLLSETYRWEEMIEQWPPPFSPPPKPSKKELIDFFRTKKGMPLSFRKELMEKNYEILYSAYDLFYPILVLKEEFLTSIFRDDVRARRYKKVFKESKSKFNRITEKINQLKENNEFVQMMQRFASDLSGYSLTLINNKKLLDRVVVKLEKG